MYHLFCAFEWYSCRTLCKVNVSKTCIIFFGNAQKRWYMSYLHSVCRTFDNCIIWIYNIQVRRYMQAIGTTATTLHTQNKAKVVHWDKLNTMTMKLPTHNKEQLAKNALSQTTGVRWVFISYPDEVYSIQHYVKKWLATSCACIYLLTCILYIQMIQLSNVLQTECK
jgi:hypothetical protein